MHLEYGFNDEPFRVAVVADHPQHFANHATSRLALNMDHEIDRLADLRFDDIPRQVLERAKVLTLDFLGSAIRARRDAESTPSLLKMLEALALDGRGNSTVFGDSKTWTPAVAALLNGALGHSLDFDDTHADSSLHPSAPVVPAAFAVGEMVGASGRDVLTAIVAGYEVCCRLGNALDPTSHYARGFHPTATAGTYGDALRSFGSSQRRLSWTKNISKAPRTKPRAR